MVSGLEAYAAGDRSDAKGDVVFGDPKTARVLTTTRRDGTPHAVFADWLVAPDPNTLAYLEPFELSRTSANLLHHLWDKRRVSIALLNADRRVRCEISCTVKRIVSEGPLWDQLSEKCLECGPRPEPLRSLADHARGGDRSEPPGRVGTDGRAEGKLHSLVVLPGSA